MSLVPIDDLNKVRNSDRSTYRSMSFMTKYEFNELISLRTLHLAKGAPPMIDIEDDYKTKTNMDLRKIALQELKDKKLPYIIKRVMPNGKIEYWNVDDLDLITVKHLFRET